MVNLQPTKSKHVCVILHCKFTTHNGTKSKHVCVILHYNIHPTKSKHVCVILHYNIHPTKSKHVCVILHYNIHPTKEIKNQKIPNWFLFFWYVNKFEKNPLALIREKGLASKGLITLEIIILKTLILTVATDIIL